MSSKNPRESREGMIDEIKLVGQYLIDHAENLLGEYPSMLNEFEITACINNGCCTTIEIKRSHIVVDREAYIRHKESFGKLAIGN